MAVNKTFYIKIIDKETIVYKNKSLIVRDILCRNVKFRNDDSISN